MCEVCQFVHCPGGCPNAPEPVAVACCRQCGAALYAGDDCYRIEGEYWCEECVDECRAVAEDELSDYQAPED